MGYKRSDLKKSSRSNFQRTPKKKHDSKSKKTVKLPATPSNIYKTKSKDNRIHLKQVTDELNRLASFPQLNPNPVLEVDPSGKITSYNDATLTTLKRLKLKKDLRVFLPEDIQQILHTLNQKKEKQFYREVNIGERVFGETLYLAARFDVVRIYANDITEHKRAEEALHESKERLKRAQEIAHLGSWELDLVNNVLTWSDEVYSIFGLRPQEFDATYEAFLESVHPDDRAAVDAAYSSSLREGRDIYEIEHRVVRKSTGQIRIVHEKCEHIRDEAGRIIRSMGMVHDITERKLAEDALRKARDELEIRVQQRTLELSETNKELQEKITERKKAEEALRLSETRYRSLMEQAPDGIVLLDHNMNIIEVNTMACRITGYTREELLSINTHKITSPDELDDIALSFQRVLSGETVVEKRKLLKRDGSMITIEASVKIIQDRFIKVIFRDITARIEEENRVTTTNVLLELFTKSSSRKEYLDSVVQVIHQWSSIRCIGIRVLDSHGYIPYESYTGFSHEFLKLENMLSLKKDMCACIRSFTGKFEPVDSSILTPKGSVCINDSQEFASSLTKDEIARFRGNCIKSGFLTIVLIPLRYGGQTIGVIHLTDERAGMASFSVMQFLETISNLIVEAIHRFNTEEALRKSEASLSEAQRIARVGNWEWDVNTDRFYWSDEVYRVFGLSPHQFTPSYDAFLGFVHSDDREPLEESIKEAFYQKTPYAIDHRIVLQDGREKTIHEQGEIIFNEKGAPLRMIGTVQDITEIKRIENELRGSQEQLRELYAHLQSIREEERTRIAREIHDEFGTILTALKIDLSTLEKKLSEDQGHLFQRIKNDIELINDAIKIVQRISAELRPGILDYLGLSAAIEWQVKEFANRTGIDWEVSINVTRTDLDRELSTAVFRILQEALTNIARHAKATRIHVNLKDTDSLLILEVADNGEGIPEDKLSDPHSFGLLGMKERVDYFNGDIAIKGERNKGTTVTLKVPIEKQGERK